MLTSKVPHGKIEKKFFAKERYYGQPERRKEKKKYEKDFTAFCKIMKQYFPKFTEWMGAEEPKEILDI